MRRKENFLLSFVVFFLLSLGILGLSKTGILNPLSAVFQKVLSPLQSVTYGVFNNVELLGSNGKLKQLENENLNLSSMLSDQIKLQKENSALSDQFQTVSPKSYSLIPADIVGAPGFIPGISVPESYVINRGTADGIRVGEAVIYKNNVVGKITKTNNYLSEVSLVSNTESSFTAKTSVSGSLGVIKGQGGGQMVLDNVILSDNLTTKELVLTNGDTNLSGSGYPPGLIVGRIISIDKNPSALFQKANVESLLDFSHLITVFVISQ